MKHGDLTIALQHISTNIDRETMSRFRHVKWWTTFLPNQNLADQLMFLSGIMEIMMRSCRPPNRYRNAIDFSEHAKKKVEDRELWAGETPVWMRYATHNPATLKVVWCLPILALQLLLLASFITLPSIDRKEFHEKGTKLIEAVQDKGFMFPFVLPSVSPRFSVVAASWGNPLLRMAFIWIHLVIQHGLHSGHGNPPGNPPSKQEHPNAPIIIMGDFNALEDWKSTKLYLGEVVHDKGEEFQHLAWEKKT